MSDANVRAVTKARLTMLPLVAVVTVLLAALALPSLSRASTGFTLIPDPAQPSLPAGSHLEKVADLTGNFADLVIVNEARNQIGVMQGDGHGGFAPPSWTSLTGNAGFIAVADINGDDHPDLVVPIETVISPQRQYPIPDKVEILYGDGHGNFTVGPVIELPEAGPVYVGDFNGDDKQDLLVTPGGCRADTPATRDSVLLGDGEGGFSPAPAPASTSETPSLGGCRSLVADLNGDGRDDLLTEVTVPEKPPTIMVLPGEANGSFGAPIISPMLPPGVPNAFIVGLADLDGDGALDLVLRSPANPTAQVLVLDGNGAGGFTPAGAYPAEQPNRYEFGVGVGDFTGDGHPDVATVGSQISVLADESGVLSNTLNVPLTEAYDDVLVADVNGDGRPDLIFPNPKLQIFLDEPSSPTLVAPIDRSLAGPLLRAVGQKHVRWRIARSPGSAHGTPHSEHLRAPIGTSFSFTLNEQSSVSFDFLREIPGRRVGRACGSVHMRLGRHHKACTRAASVGKLLRGGAVGINRLSFSGWLTSSNHLAPGRYTVVITATANGRSASGRLGFTVVR